MKTERPDAEDAKSTQKTQKDIQFLNDSFASSAKLLRLLRPEVLSLGFE